MITGSQIRNGMVIIHEGEPHKVVSFKYTMSGRGSNSIPAKLKSIVSGSTKDVRFRSDDKVEKAYIDEVDMEYLYSDQDDFWFMNNETFEQINISRDDLGDAVNYITPNTNCKVQFYENRPVGIILPNTLNLKVKDTEPVLKGATASGNVTKPATLETGYKIQVPMFVKKGDICEVNTSTGEYQGRPSKK
ncbi:MAG: elongation factor P [Chitinivibrionales bacterium]